MDCFRCKKPLGSPPKPIPFLFKLMAAFSLAPLHGGAWAWEEYSKEYCGSCRLKLSLLAVLLAGLVITGAVSAFRWVIKLGLLKF